MHVCTVLYEVGKNKFNDAQHLILPALEIKIPYENEDLELILNT